ncbi:MAG: electron transfer flavoprotein subunit alpha/FixB family protein [Anaerolineales bacterium]|nr:electron transfer flavoprotein subunit alpha/FixB family protein [Anaerolineales bacterium]
MAVSLYGPEDARQTVCVYLEHNAGRLEDVSLGLISKALELTSGSDWRVCGLILGDDTRKPAQEALARGLGEVISIQHEIMTRFDVSAFTRACFEVILQEKPAVFILGATPDGRDLAGRLAVRLRTGLNADCTDLRLNLETGQLISEVSGFGGGVIALLESPAHRPQMSTVRPGVFEQQFVRPVKSGVIRQIDVSLSRSDLQSELLERSVGERLDLSKSQVLICGGRGMHGEFVQLNALAEQLGGEVGATRPPVDEGYIERERQIGQTGVVCRPKLAVTCGISGAFHFVVGIQEADTVVAINIDPQAEIFNYCDYGVVADAHQVIPALIEALARESHSSHA